MATNLEGQLKQQNAADRLDGAGGNPRVREDLGFAPAGDLADCRHPGGQRLTGEALQNHCQRNGGHSEGSTRIRPTPGAGERAALRARV